VAVFAWGWWSWWWCRWWPWPPAQPATWWRSSPPDSGRRTARIRGWSARGCGGRRGCGEEAARHRGCTSRAAGSWTWPGTTAGAQALRRRGDGWPSWWRLSPTWRPGRRGASCWNCGPASPRSSPAYRVKIRFLVSEGRWLERLGV